MLVAGREISKDAAARVLVCTGAQLVRLLLEDGVALAGPAVELEIEIAVRGIERGQGGRRAAGITNKVMLCAGRVLLKVPPVKAMSLRCVIVFAAVSCQTCAVPAGKKFVTANVAVAFVPSCLLMAMMVSEPSEERRAANVATRSGFGPPA